MNNYKIKMENKLLKSEIKLSSVKQGRTISKLVIQISHTCNLQCPYCCSDKGLYGKNSAQLMSSQIISDSLELFARLFDGIKSIYLFGGEPTLNLKGIETVCKKLNSLVKEGFLKTLPTIGLTTNGVNLSDEFFRLVKDYKINVSVSMDGPPFKIHSYNKS